MKFEVKYTYTTQQKILSQEQLIKKVLSWRFARKVKVVFTNGCFDLLHLGHVDYLEKASQLGDYLIVALNSDSSVSQIKGQERPILEQEARARIIAALEFVDAVTVFEEATPEKLIRAVMPDILVKGGDYTHESIAGADWVKQNGGQVILLPFLEGYSTTKIIQKIRETEFK
ncbi:MAG: D-glycero-beta-D-manno-heptose 1-phosphate adenylyltransferase [Bacteroidia bacterium]|nr:D-glycero-beta-D-manno-heptose 1-phosphate adenylyltransferase [Bacteroidia bacterium]MDW8158995.1 D-glycero-beta-D-manno-heptose 1-phosphate adenylyltransferase [Bacteroidia bacterium]